jgi:hypothetical protein
MTDTDIAAANGAVNTPPRELRASHQVRFGQRDNQVIRLDVAEQVLTMWAEREPQRFGAYLSAVLLGTDVTSRRGA